MKISNRTHPILNLLPLQREFPFYVHEVDIAKFDGLSALFNKHLKPFCDRINPDNILYVSNEFGKAAWGNATKLINAGLLPELVGESGIMLLGNLSFIYSVDISPKGNTIIQFLALKNEVISGSYWPLAFCIAGEQINIVNLFCSKAIKMLNDIPNPTETFQCQIATILLFKKFAEVETCLIPSGSKKKMLNCKYVNSTRYNVTYLDCKWFTTFVKSDGFKVRGHFRLQPCGEGMKDRKLIWINDFDKTGYTAPARKLSAESDV